MERIRQLPRGATAEDTMRVLTHEHEMMSADCVREALQRLLGILDEHPEIDVCWDPPFPLHRFGGNMAAKY